MIAAGSNPFLFGLIGGGIELAFTGKRSGSVMIVGGVDEHDSTGSNAPDDSEGVEEKISSHTH